MRLALFLLIAGRHSSEFCYRAIYFAKQLQGCWFWRNFFTLNSFIFSESLNQAPGFKIIMFCAFP